VWHGFSRQRKQKTHNFFLLDDGVARLRAARKQKKLIIFFFRMMGWHGYLRQRKHRALSPRPSNMPLG
jgi:hypothetical protein